MALVSVGIQRNRGRCVVYVMEDFKRKLFSLDTLIKLVLVAIVVAGCIGLAKCNATS